MGCAQSVHKVITRYQTEGSFLTDLHSSIAKIADPSIMTSIVGNN